MNIIRDFRDNRDFGACAGIDVAGFYFVLCTS